MLYCVVIAQVSTFFCPLCSSTCTRSHLVIRGVPTRAKLLNLPVERCNFPFLQRSTSICP